MLSSIKVGYSLIDFFWYSELGVQKLFRHPVHNVDIELNWYLSINKTDRYMDIFLRRETQAIQNELFVIVKPGKCSEL